MNKRSGLQPSRYNLKKTFSTWLLQHAQASIFSLGQLFKQPLNSFLTTAVVGIALSLPAGFYLLLDNSQRVAADWDNSSEISLFLQTGLEQEQVTELATALGQWNGISAVRHISPEQALEEFISQTGSADISSTLGENPLPAILLLQPEIENLSIAAGEEMLEKLRALPEVDSAQFDRQWIQRLFAIIDIVRKAVTILAIVLAIAVLLIVGNTIRLAIYNRRSEIEVNKLFGATDAFIQRPFLYSGIFQGIGGSLMAWALLSLTLFLMEAPVSRLAELYASQFRLHGLAFSEVLFLLLSGASLGLAGSWVSVKRHIRDIEPA
ncbi:MAG: cell division protein FtsX [Gammaproteobacteria bacterium]|nr:cell division protein FtsX [Gammaproteobacteria bacterium]